MPPLDRKISVTLPRYCFLDRISKSGFVGRVAGIITKRTKTGRESDAVTGSERLSSRQFQIGPRRALYSTINIILKTSINSVLARREVIGEVKEKVKENERTEKLECTKEQRKAHKSRSSTKKHSTAVHGNARPPNGLKSGKARKQASKASTNQR